MHAQCEREAILDKVLYSIKVTDKMCKRLRRIRLRRKRLRRIPPINFILVADFSLTQGRNYCILRESPSGKGEWVCGGFAIWAQS